MHSSFLTRAKPAIHKELRTSAHGAQKLRRKTLKCVGLVIVLVFAQSAVAQQNPHGQLPVTSVAQPYLFLIRDPLVHDELGLSAGQRQAIRAFNDQWDGPFWSMRNKSAQHIDETVQTATAEARNRLSSILTLDQQKRLVQIEMWTLGTKMLLRDDLVNNLEPSETQLKKIRQTLTDTQQAINDLSKRLESGESRESLEKEARALRADEQEQIVATLTRRQQQLWLALLGERIDVSKLGRVKFKAPELDGQDGWINSPPLTLRQLKGKVVALHFYAFA
jgi:hypothetical protein